MKTMWNKFSRARIITANSDINYLRELYDSFRVSGMNINELEWFVWIDDSEKASLVQSKLNCSLFSKKHFGLFNRIKDKALRAKWEKKANAIMVFGEIPEQLKKILRASKGSYICSINENLSFASINLATDKTDGSDQVYFVKNTLDKISTYE